MLDKKLCALFGVDEFAQWLMKELDDLEDILTDKSKTSNETDNARYQALLEVRDVYCMFMNKNRTK